MSEIEKLENEGWIMSGTVTSSGCDKEVEIWVSPDGKGQVEYCPGEYLNQTS